jgi:4Fe-4S ferredoxin
MFNYCFKATLELRNLIPVIVFVCVIGMAFSVHVNVNRCTGCGNCVIACPVNALELFTLDPVTNEKIYQVQDGVSVSLDVKTELCAGCGVCVEACPYDVIQLSGKGSGESLVNV